MDQPIKTNTTWIGQMGRLRLMDRWTRRDGWTYPTSRRGWMSKATRAAARMAGDEEAGSARDEEAIVKRIEN